MSSGRSDHDHLDLSSQPPIKTTFPFHCINYLKGGEGARQDAERCRERLERMGKNAKRIW